jgi:hypothetical protein
MCFALVTVGHSEERCLGPIVKTGWHLDAAGIWQQADACLEHSGLLFPRPYGTEAAVQADTSLGASGVGPN